LAPVSWTLWDIPSVDADQQPRVWVLSLHRKPPRSYYHPGSNVKVYSLRVWRPARTLGNSLSDVVSPTRSVRIGPNDPKTII